MKVRNSYILLILLCVPLLFPLRIKGQAASEPDTAKLLTFKEMSESGELYQKARELYESKKYPEAAALYAESFDILKTNKKAAYNAACAYAMAGEKDKAMKYAWKALEQGIFDFEQDPDFDNIKHTPEFRELVGMSALMKKQMNTQPIKPVVILPDAYNGTAKHPLVVAFHGFGGSPNEFAAHYKEVAQKYNCILMLSRGSKPLGKDVFAWTYEQDEYERILDEIEITKRNYNIDDNHVILTGFSQGGFLTYALGMVYSEMFCGLLPVGGSMPDNISVSNMKNKKVKVFAIVGTRVNDEVVRHNEKAKREFLKYKVPFKLNKFDIGGYVYPDNETEVLSAAFEWFLSD